ncbi:MAG: hypothetical protein WBK18_02670 [Thermacetogeniaceae bacterium]
MAIKHDEITVYHPEHLHQNNDAATRRQHALKRASELKEKIEDYLAVKDKIYTGFDLVEKYNEARSRILNYFNGSDEDWIDWRWQLRRRISTVDQLSQFVDLTDKEKE